VLAFSPDGRLLACSSPDTIWIWNTVTYALHRIPESLRDIMALSFSPDSRILASCSTIQTFTFDVDLWDATTGVLLRTFETRSSPIKEWKFSPDGRLLASVSTDHQIRLSDVTGVGKNKSGGVGTPVLFSNRRLFDADILKIAWDLSDVSSKRKLFLAFSADTALLACLIGQELTVWDTSKRSLEHGWETPKEGVVSLSFSDDGSLLTTNMGSFVLRDGDQNIVMWLSFVASPDRIYVHEDWWVHYGKNAMRLPVEYQPTRWTVRGKTHMQGYKSGDCRLFPLFERLAVIDSSALG
jgi:WD40 repeat protein